MAQEELQNIVWDEHEDYITIQTELAGRDRWHTYYEQVVKQVSTGQYFALYWGTGATENQEWDGEISMQEVMPQEVTVTKYIKV